MSYETELLATKTSYPFDRWRKLADNSEGYGLEQYTEENCGAAEKILDGLLAQLGILGPDAPEAGKLAKFKLAVEALNSLNEEEDSLIETGEREELCELFNIIAVKAGLDPTQYGDGEGPASEWRDW